MNKDIKTLYNELIKQVLIDNHIKEIVSKDLLKDKFFDKVKVYHFNEEISVYHNGLMFNRFLFDFTVDFARMLDYIETDIYAAVRCSETKYFDIKFDNYGIIKQVSNYLIHNSNDTITKLASDKVFKMRFNNIGTSYFYCNIGDEVDCKIIK